MIVILRNIQSRLDKIEILVQEVHGILKEIQPEQKNEIKDKLKVRETI